MLFKLLVRVLIIPLFLCVINECIAQVDTSLVSMSKYPTKKVKLSAEELKAWHMKDYQADTIPGISLEKLYNSGLIKGEGETIIVAVLDTKLDIHHEDLINQIWTNDDEIANNGIDDDNNGYIDDVNGWDFINSSDDDTVQFTSMEVSRIIRVYGPLYENRDSSALNASELEEFNLYKKALKEHEGYVEEYQSLVDYFKNWKIEYYQADSIVKNYLGKEAYNLSSLDSLSDSIIDSTLIKEVDFLKSNIEYNNTLEEMESYAKLYEGVVKICLDVNHNDRAMLGDDPNNLTDSNYGYGKVWGEVLFEHSIAVTGVIASERNNNLGTKGFADNIRIMPVVMVAMGDEHDKDVALAIRYAVDNGARVINMSWGKVFSLHQDWVLDAMKYAAKHDVLLVTGAGNDHVDTDEKIFFPTDNRDEIELIDNLIVVGASSYESNKNLIAYFSNYGRRNVDVFAPGEEIYSTESNNKYGFADGTSIASPLVAGLAALLRSHFPEFRAEEIKDIILDSGIYYDLPVIIYDEDYNEELRNFNELSKTGSIVNAFNAFLLAKERYDNRYSKTRK